MAKPWGGKLPALAKDRAVREGWRDEYEGEHVNSREHTDMATFYFIFERNTDSRSETIYVFVVEIRSQDYTMLGSVVFFLFIRYK